MRNLMGASFRTFREFVEHQNKVETSSATQGDESIILNSNWELWVSSMVFPKPLCDVS
jgi:hypothetical protein